MGSPSSPTLNLTIKITQKTNTETETEIYKTRSRRVPLIQEGEGGQKGGKEKQELWPEAQNPWIAV